MSEPIIVPDQPVVAAPEPDGDGFNVDSIEAALRQDGKVSETPEDSTEDSPWKASSLPSKQEQPSKQSEPDEPAAEVKPKLDFTPKEPAAPETTDEIPEDAAVPRKSEDWKKFRKSYNETRALLRDRDAKLAELQNKTESLKQLETIQKERDELAAKFKELSVVGDPDLTKDLDGKMKVSMDAAKRGLDAKKAALVETIARMPDSDARTNMLNELLEDLPASKQVLLGSHLAALEQLNAEREARVSDARQNADAILTRRQQEKEAQTRTMREQLDRAFSDTANALKSKDGWKDIFENKELAAAVEASAKQIYNGNLNDPRVLAEKAIHAAVTPMLMEYAIQQATQLAEAQRTINELKAAGPKINATGGNRTGKTPADYDGFSVEAIMAAANG